MGILVENKVKEFVAQGLSKKEARKKAHDYCYQTNTCRCCSKYVRPDNWASWKKDYCLNCG